MATSKIIKPNNETPDALETEIAGVGLSLNSKQVVKVAFTKVLGG